MAKLTSSIGENDKRKQCSDGSAWRQHAADGHGARIGDAIQFAFGGGGIATAMAGSGKAFVVRHCEMRDVSPVGDLLKVCWHSTYDRMLGQSQAIHFGRRAYSKFSLGLLIAQSLVSRASIVLVATEGDVPVGYAMAQRDGAAEIILYGLYVHPEWKGKGIGSALLDTVIAGHPGAKVIRLEVLRDNAAAIAWYQAKGFEIYGETKHATGTENIPALYMDRTLGGV